MPENEQRRVRVGALGGRSGQGGFVLPGGAWAARLIGTLSAWLADGFRIEAAAFDLAMIVPVFLGLGVIAYFAAPDEPALGVPLVATLIGSVAACLLRRRWRLHVVLICLTCIGVGFCSAKLRTLSMEAPQLTRSLAANTTGLVLSVEARVGAGARIVMRPVSIEGVPDKQLPGRIRFTVRKVGDIRAGDSITTKILLRSPPPPVVPGGYDFARDAYFDGIGAVGFASGKILPAANTIEPGILEELNIWIDNQRNALTRRIVTAIPGENGAIAASQVTGKRGQIPEDANDALRASGLYHVVSISGLHMALFAGGLFWLIRALLALSRHIALYRGTKELAAMLSLLPAAAYTLFSGAEVATMRSFIMTAIVLMAMALGRNAITRRNVALSASFILLTTPEQLLGPSFQMSFSAVAMLVVMAELWSRRHRVTFASSWERAIAKGLVVLLAMMLTTLVASLATAPFSAYHFHRITLQSLASNLVATPIVSFLIMPLALVALIAEPFGYGAFFWDLMGRAVGLFMQVARYVAEWPGSNLTLPQFSAAALCLFSLTIIMLAVMRSRLALFAMLPLGWGFALALGAEKPVAILGANGYAALVRNGDELTSLADKSDKFAVKSWLLAAGDGREPGDTSLSVRKLCDKEGCSAPIEGGGRFMLDRTANAIEEDCGRVSVLAAPLEIAARCSRGGLVLDRDLIRAAGSVALYATPGTTGQSAPAWRIVMARAPGTSRPWAPAVPALKPSVPVPEAETSMDVTQQNDDE